MTETETKINVMLNSVQDVKDFVNATASFHGPCTVGSDPYLVDAKSLMGILSLNLSKPVVFATKMQMTEDEIVAIEPFTVK